MKSIARDIDAAATRTELDHLYVSKVNELVSAGREELIVEVTEEYLRVLRAA